MEYTEKEKKREWEIGEKNSRRKKGEEAEENNWK